MSRLPMAPPSLAATLRRGDWFAALAPEMQQRILDLGEQVSLLEGQCLFARGDAPDGVYCVLQGTVRISTVTEAGREMIVALLEPPHWFGEIALFDNALRTHDAWAAGDTSLLRLPQRKLEKMLARHPQDWPFFGRLLTQKLRAVFSAMEDIALTSPTARVARRLVNMTDGFGTLAAGSGQPAQDCGVSGGVGLDAVAVPPDHQSILERPGSRRRRPAHARDYRDRRYRHIDRQGRRVKSIKLQKAKRGRLGEKR